ncbi:Putative ribonuclease/ribotoxin [Septoria linicola]|uniref:Ribonuclease/ribotoxin n=1 Tax=Septoria linicola TaxID=215465 RepID=A0A9Q9AUM6_9PEZI|nr:putative ribonuclease/ribotoxin [Septoria linicola]USW55699.1 Putative ribonuclease/ribotoxin [Septoria linicola]
MLDNLLSYYQTVRFNLADLMLVSILAQLFFISRSIADGLDAPWFTASNSTKIICHPGQACQQEYRCPPDSKVVFTHSHVLETIKIGQQSEYNDIKFSGATYGSWRYPHIFRAHDTNRDIQDAIINSVSHLPTSDSIKRWMTEENIIEYPVMLGHGQYWQPDLGIDPGAYRILAQRDPANPTKWVLCAVIAHVGHSKKAIFQLCEVEWRGLDGIDDPEHDHGLTDDIFDLPPRAHLFDSHHSYE